MIFQIHLYGRSFRSATRASGLSPNSRTFGDQRLASWWQRRQPLGRRRSRRRRQLAESNEFGCGCGRRFHGFAQLTPATNPATIATAATNVATTRSGYCTTTAAGATTTPITHSPGSITDGTVVTWAYTRTDVGLDDYRRRHRPRRSNQSSSVARGASTKRLAEPHRVQ